MLCQAFGMEEQNKFSKRFDDVCSTVREFRTVSHHRPKSLTKIIPGIILNILISEYGVIPLYFIMLIKD